MDVADSHGRGVDPRGLADDLEVHLRSSGLVTGDVVAAAVPNGPEFAAAFIACLRLGVGFAPVHPALASSELEQRLQRARATAVVAAGGRLVRRREDFPREAPAPAVILFTSGSSGESSAVAVAEHGLLAVVDSHHAALAYGPGTRITGSLPWTHAFGFTLEFLMGLLHGASLRPVPPDRLVAALGEEQSVFFFGVPRTVSAIPDPILGALAGGIVGGAPVRGGLRARLRSTRLRVGYGQTECSPGVTLGDAGEWARDDFLGRPVGCEVTLGPPDEDGGTEILVKGDNVALGRMHRDHLRPLVDPEGWHRTGDLAVRTEDGGFVFQGRADERFKLDNGRMVNPIPLELSFGDTVLLIGAGRPMVQPLVRGDVPPDFHLPLPHRPPRVMPESFWSACTTPSGKVSRRRAEELFVDP